MSHDFEPEPHEKAMIDVMLKGNTTPKWIYDFNKFLIAERTTGEIIKFIDELLHQELQKARAEAQEEYKQFVLNVLDGVDIADGQCNTKAIRFALQSRIIQSERNKYVSSQQS